MMNISTLFTGFDQAHGTYNVQRTNERGKKEGKALTVPGPATEELWNNHLAGRGPGLGIIPLLADNTVVWSCIDIDDHSIDLAALEKKINELELPLVVARSKSGGAHCFLFLKEPMDAAIVRRVMASWAAALSYGGSEIFPKQSSRYNDQDIGNWLNMPYYNAEMTLRYGIKDGQPLSLDEFVAHANEQMAEPEDVVPIKLEIENGPFNDGPPCLAFLYRNGGFPEGTRNDGMYNVAVYLRKKYPDHWPDRLQEYNVKMCDPPLSLGEINTLAKSIGRKEYNYRCKQQPIVGHCNRAYCLEQQFGVGDGYDEEATPEVSKFTKHEGDPVFWFCEIRGRRVMLTTEEILSQRLFMKKYTDIANHAAAPMPARKWIKFINDRMENCDVVETPEEASPLGQFKLLLEQYLRGQAQATSKEELAHRMTPYRTGTGEVWFRSRGILDYLTTHGFRYKTEHHVWQMLRSLNAEHRSVNVKKIPFNIWILPEPAPIEDDAPLPDFGSEDF